MISLISLSYPFHGMVTDLNTWNRWLERSEVRAWSECEGEAGNIVNWSQAELSLRGLDIVHMEKEEVCGSVRPRHLVFTQHLDFVKTQKFCATIGGTIAVVSRDNHQEIKEAIAEVAEAELTCPAVFFTGHERVGQHWRDPVKGEALVWDAWKDVSYYDSCAMFSPDEEFFQKRDCGVEACPICRIEDNPSTLQLRGFCLHTSLDTFYNLENSVRLRGYSGSTIQWVKKESIWKITRADKIVAFLNDTNGVLPLGVNQWYFENCTDRGKVFRSLNLHLAVEQPGNFCCDDGHCIDSELVCDGREHCDDGSDERDCRNVVFESNYYPSLAPTRKIQRGLNVSFENVNLKVNIKIVDILNIDDTKSTITLQFSMEQAWKDFGVKFPFLKRAMRDNEMNQDDLNKIWRPDIRMMSLANGMVEEISSRAIVARHTKPTMSADIDQLRPSEIYLGSENPFIVLLLCNAKFRCSFSTIGEYPFGNYVCTMHFFLQGNQNKLVKFNMKKLIDEGPKIYRQYKIKKWEFQSEVLEDARLETIRVSLHLELDISSIFMVTFLPTILMNIINQATNFISGDDKYSMIYTINITCMMVLTSVYLSVSTSLPSTSNIKPVEIWLLASLAYPFIIILLNVCIQVSLCLV